MNAEIVAVGTELLLGDIVDTNSAELSRLLAELGVNVYYHSSVGDNPLRMAAVLAQAMIRSDLVIISGGLGPTEDDITREVLAAVTGRPLEQHPDALAHVEGYFRSTGQPMSANNLKQSLAPRGAAILPNPRGTAPGIYLEHNGVHVFCVPGVPTEMRTMVRESVVPRIAALQGTGAVIRSRTLKFYGIGEAALEERVSDLLHSTNPTLAPYASVGEVRLRITARADGPEAAEALIEPVQRELERRLAGYHYGYDDDTLESVVGRLLAERSWRVAVAESCTGGLVAHRLTNIPGSSRYVEQGWVTYSNEAKIRELGVDPVLLERHGAVSAEVATAMAQGALKRSGADLAVATTGIAGPGGGSEAKPVGLVYFACAMRDGTVSAHSRRFRGGREDIKWRAASEALNVLRRAVLL